MKRKSTVLRIIENLKVLYPDAVCSLTYQKDYELLFATRLSAQCTDARVNQVTPELFSTYPTLEALAEASVEDVGRIIHSAASIRPRPGIWWPAPGCCWNSTAAKCPTRWSSSPPCPGVGRKTANLVLGDIFHKPAVVADTHCIRITGRLGLTDGSKDPVQVEKQLRAVLPPEESSDFCHRMVLHGRAVCMARGPVCDRCLLKKDCDFAKANKIK